MRVLVTYPDFPGVYVPLIFIPGLNGIVYAEFYTDVLNYVASHGYVLLSFDLGWPVMTSARHPLALNGYVPPPEEEPELLFEALHWVTSAITSTSYGRAITSTSYGRAITSTSYGRAITSTSYGRAGAATFFFTPFLPCC